MTDELDKMSEAELNRIFAVEVAGWHADLPIQYTSGYRPGSDRPEPIPPYATDANAVLPWLEKNDSWHGGYDGTGGPITYECEVFSRASYFKAMAPTFARAACVSLIRAKRAQNVRTGQTP
jgi:hypothetical protein